MAKVETMDVLVAMAKAILEIAGEVEATPAKAEKPTKVEKAKAEKKAAPADTEDTEDDGLESKTTKELYQMCVDAGIKVPKYGKNKAFYIAALQGGAEEDADDEADDETGDETGDDPYAGKSAKELFGMCKKRGIKVEAKQKAAVYIEALKKADAAEAEADDDDWDDDDEVEEEAPKKQTKQKAKAKAKKPAEPEEDEDDDWDI